MCTMLLKETLAYYSSGDGIALHALLDATKAFDRVDFCKLFWDLIKREIPPSYLRLLLNMYTNNIMRVSWNGMCSGEFVAKNGVKQGGVISPVLVCILDGLLVTTTVKQIQSWLFHW